MSEFTFEVRGMRCGSCEAILQNRVTELEGVARVEADADASQVRIEAEQAARERAIQRIEATGYEVEAE